jgi:NDP-sugar pyrophosphorylase family protein
VLRGGDVQLLGSDIQDWTITFVHTGLDSRIGERLRRVRRHVADEEMFLANYADALTDAPLDRMVEQFRASDAVGPLPAARAGSCGRQHRRPRAFVDAVDLPWASHDTRGWWPGGGR